MRGSAPVCSGEFIHREIGSITGGSFRRVIKGCTPDMYVFWDKLVKEILWDGCPMRGHGSKRGF
jgi:hypothetical protein